jgi:hypothetical protein
MALSGLQRVFKIVRQIGLTQAALYAMYKFGLKTKQYQLLTETHRLQTEINGVSLAIRGLFTFPQRDQLADTLGEDGQQVLITQADEIVYGKFRMFGGEPVEIKLAFDQPLRHWTDYETGKSPIPESQFPNSDIKFIWEPARFGWAFALGRAYHLTQDETYAETFWNYFESFTDANPPNIGPYWMNGQEVAIRLMALVWAGQVFETARISSVERRARLAGSVAAHAARIPPTLPYARAQDNNHLLSEAAGLYTSALALPDHPRARRWRQLGIKWLDWCFAHQIDKTGEYIQHSTNYHRLMLQLALWVTSLKGDTHRFAHDEKLAFATRWLAAQTDPISGRAVNLGANDGAYIFPLANGEFRDFRPVAQAASRAFLDADAWASGAWDEMSLWFGEADPKPRQEADEIIPVYPVIHSENSWGMLHAAGWNLRLAHADLLHVDLWWRGQNIALDPGTYMYNGEPPWDNPWPATRYHNTVTINMADQMTRAGRFLYLDWAKADWGYGADLNRGEQGLHASHNGYHKFGLWHHRDLIQSENRWEIQDNIYPTSTGQVAPFSARLHWLLPDWGWELENQNAGCKVRIKSPHGWIDLVVSSELPLNVSLVRAGEVVYGKRDAQPNEGWVSPTYGSKTPALSLAFEVQCDQSISFRTEFIFPNES